MRARVRSVLARLADHDRELLTLSYLEQLSAREIAAVLEVGINAVNMRHFFELEIGRGEAAYPHATGNCVGRCVFSRRKDTSISRDRQDGQIMACRHGAELGTLETDVPISSVQFTSDGESLAAAGLDKSIVVWRTDGTRNVLRHIP